MRGTPALALAAVLGGLGAGPPAHATVPAARPDVLLLTVDTLRADHMSIYGYPEAITPNLDRLLRSGARFLHARTTEPLTAPAIGSLLTSMAPHRHGAARNGLRLHRGLASLPKALQAHGYRTAAFVSNWTLRDDLSRLGEHFETYAEILTRRRWFGLVRAEATAEDVTAAALGWFERHAGPPPRRPILLWVHYSDPHAPYRLHEEHARALGIGREDVPPAGRYATEVAFTDRWAGRLLAEMGRAPSPAGLLVAFAADHGESLGEHGYWGHGRHLYEPSLRIPMGVAWAGHVRPRTIEAPALILDLAPTLLGLLAVPSPGSFAGHDWGGVLAGARPPAGRVTRHQAHRGAIQVRHESRKARRSGLLELALIRSCRKEILAIDGDRSVFDLGADPGETHDLSAAAGGVPSDPMAAWRREVLAGLASGNGTPPARLEEETVRALRSLGYVQ